MAGSGWIRGLASLVIVAGLAAPVIRTGWRISAAPAAVAISIDVAADRRPISPEIYGLNYATEAFANEIDLPVRRWGGNLTSRYNWQLNTMNHGSDFHFENNAFFDEYTFGPLTADQWVQQNARTGTESMLTVPMMGFVAKDGASCGFDTVTYGYTPLPGTSDENKPRCADGIRNDSSLVVGTNPLDTSLAIGSAFVSGWVNHLKTTHGAANSGGVRYYSLDNEPDGWHETHRDVHPAPVSYDELLTRTIGYASAIKAADPGAQVFGFAPTGWYAYFYSRSDMVAAAANGYTSYPDKESHGNRFLADWYLQELRAFDQTNGVRLLDYFDVHFYPQQLDACQAGSPAMQAERLGSVRALWDSTYDGTATIGGGALPPEWQHTRLIPRLKSLVAADYPGAKLALSEYNWGALDHINGALAQADILGVFGREGLDFATLWNDVFYCAGYGQFDTLPGAYAFRMFRNYDGAGQKFGDVSVRAQSGDQATLAAYAAQRTSDSAVTVLVVNKANSAQTAAVSLSGFSPATATKAYRYSDANLGAIVQLSDGVATAAGFTATIPANSMTLFTLMPSVPVATPTATPTANPTPTATATPTAGLLPRQFVPRAHRP